MLRRYGQVAVVVLPILVSGCQSAVPSGIFINQKNQQVLELRPDVSQTPNVLIRLGMESGATKVFGKTVGVYKLTGAPGNTAGTFVSFKPMRSTMQHMTLQSNQGQEWILVAQRDGSFKDSTGTVWRLRP